MLHGRLALRQSVGELLKPIACQSADRNDLGLRIVLGQPIPVRRQLRGLQQIAFVQYDQVRFHELCTKDKRHVAALTVPQQCCVPRLYEHRERTKLELIGEFPAQPVIDMLQRPHAEAGDV